MSRSTVRAAVAAYFTPATVTGLASMHNYPAKINNEGEFVLPTGGFGAFVYIHLQDQSEKRIALGGPTSGIKWRHYMVTLMCIYRSNDPKAEVAGTNNDAFLDAMVAHILADRKLGNSAVIFQAGEGGDTGGDDIRVQSGLPKAMKAGLVQVFSTISFQVVEMLYA